MKIKNVTDDLEEIINEKKNPIILEEDILLLKEQYETIILKLVEEIVKLQEYKTNNKLVLSTTISRRNIKNFLSF